MSLPLRIAARFLRTGKGQTVLIVLGIATAVLVQVFVGTLITSLQASLVDRTVGGQPHVFILPSEGNATIPGWQSAESSVLAVDGVKAVSPAADGQGYVSFGDHSRPSLARGLDFEKAPSVYKLSDGLEGEYPDADGETAVGADLADGWGVALGDTVVFAPFGSVPVNLTVVGIFDLGVKALNDGWLLVTIAQSQSLFGYGVNVTSLEVSVDDVFAADSVADGVESSLAGTGLRVEDWKERNAELLSGLNGQSASSYMIQVFVILSAVIAVASVLAITVMQKSKQLGILKAMGISNVQASAIFILQGSMLGALGAVIGVALGVGSLYAFNAFVRDADGSALIAIQLDWLFLVASFLIAVVSATVASLIPALKSSRLDPVEVIRNG